MSIVKNTKVATKLYIGIGGIVLLAMLIMAFVINNLVEEKVSTTYEESIQENIQNLEQIVKLETMAKQGRIRVGINLALNYLQAKGGIVESQNEFITVSNLRLNKWSLAGKQVQNENDFVDAMFDMGIAATTIFQKTPNGYLRISTNILDNEGRRAIGTFLDAESPIIKSIERKERYVGRAWVFNTWYSTAYEPLIIGGEVKGIIFVGVPEIDYTAISEFYKSKSYFGSGYPYMVDSKGIITAHPDDKTVGVSLSEYDFFKEMTKNKNGFVKYLWEGREKTQHYKYIEEIDSYITVGWYTDDYLQVFKSLQNTLIFGTIIALAAVLFVLFVIVRQVVKGINACVSISEKVAVGDLNIDIDISQNDEIGRLSKAMNEMVKSIKLLNNDAILLSDAAANGKLDTRADATKHNGDFRKIIEGVNLTLDNVIGPLNVAAEYVDRISKGDIPPKITDNYNGDFNEIKNNLNGCIDSIGKVVKEFDLLINEVSRGKVGYRADNSGLQGDWAVLVSGINTTMTSIGNIFNSASNLMVANDEGIITYLNEPVTSLLTKYENDLRKIYPDFQVNKLIGSNIDKFHKTPASNRDMLSRLGDRPHTATIHVGAEIFKLVITSLNSAEGKRLGYVVQWNNITNEARFQEILGATIEEITVGNLSKRLEFNNLEGIYKDTAVSVNQMLDSIVNPLNVAADYVDRISKGEIPALITDNYNGDFNDIKNNLNALITATNHTTNAIVSMSKGNFNFELEQRSEADNLVKSVNILKSGLISINDDLVQLASNTRSGNLEKKVNSDKYEGAFKEMISMLNSGFGSVVEVLNKMSSSVMIGDKNGIINFVNDSNRKLLVEQESSIRQSLSHFDAKSIVGSNIDNFHKNPAHQKGVLGNLKSTHRATIYLGDKIFNLVINPIIDAKGNTDCFVVEWINYTDEANFKNQLDETISSMNNGDLKKRLLVDKIGGVYKATANNINEMLNSIIRPLNVAADYVDKISKGDLPSLITDDYKGDFNEIKNNLNSMISALTNVTNIANNISKGILNDEIMMRSDKDTLMKALQVMKQSLNGLIIDVNSLAKSAQSGMLDKRADSSMHHGEYRNIIEGINNMFETVVAPVNESISVLQSVADGDLTVSMTGNYQGDLFKLKKALNDTIESISDVISQVKTTVDEVSNGSMQVSDASTALSQGATEQAASLEEITSSMSEIGSQTKTNAENANQANILTNQAKFAAEKGSTEMSQLNKAMSEITESSRNISKIIKVIDEIAFQTNLLALNAAVEAARAGRHGKGFAVVAEEVRNLAARSATAAKETADLIETSIKLVENGSALAGRTNDALDEIKVGNIKAADIVGEIATASNEQAQGIAQINEGLVQIDKVTQTNTASAEESASAAEELSGQAAMLKNMVAKFIVRNDGRNYNSYQSQRSPRMISSSRDNSKRLTASYSSEEDFGIPNSRPEDIIKLDEDDFGRY